VGNVSKFPLQVVAVAAAVSTFATADLQVMLGLVKVTLHRVLATSALINLALVTTTFLIAFGTRPAHWSCLRYQ
jgi:hypothetical protein